MVRRLPRQGHRSGTGGAISRAAGGRQGEGASPGRRPQVLPARVVETYTDHSEKHSATARLSSTGFIDRKRRSRAYVTCRFAADERCSLGVMTNPSPSPSEVVGAFAEQVRRLGESIIPVLQQVREAWQTYGPALAAIAEGLRALPEGTRLVLLKLGERGWYLDPGAPLGVVLDFVTAIDNPSADLDNLLCNWIETRAEGIEKRLAKGFPHRAHLMKQAFAAHREGRYALSIPVFLAQADGICQELHGVQLYKQRKGVIALKTRVDSQGIDGASALMLAPLLEALPIVATQDGRAPGSTLLNRHAVLHGESTTYDTLINSCRAISLLSYAAWALSSCRTANRSIS